MWRFNASDVAGSLPGYFPLSNKNTRIWSIFVIRLMGQVFFRQISQSYLLIRLLADHILNLSAAGCYSQMLFMLSPCHAQRTDLLYHSKLTHGKQAIQKVRKYFISWTGTNFGAVFVPDINHISFTSFEIKQLRVQEHPYVFKR